MLNHGRRTTKSGLVWLGDPPERNEPGLLATIREQVPAAYLWRSLTVLVLAIGLLSVPVNCAIAAGPHSIFVDPASGYRIVLHAHHAAQPAEQVNAGEDTSEQSGRGRVNNLPAPVTALTALVAVLAVSDDLQLPADPAVSLTGPSLPLAVAESPSVPPPRSI